LPNRLPFDGLVRDEVSFAFLSHGRGEPRGAMSTNIVQPIRGVPIDLDQFRAPVLAYFVNREAMHRDRC
jgi:hypothetical protein